LKIVDSKTQIKRKKEKIKLHAIGIPGFLIFVKIIFQQL